MEWSSAVFIMLGKAPEVPIGVAKQWTQHNSQAAVCSVGSGTN